MIARIHHNFYKLISFLLLHKAAFFSNLSQRREHRRQNCHIPVDLIHRSVQLSGVIRNISAKGARIEVPNQFQGGDKIKLCFQIHILDPSVEIVAFIVWADSGAMGIRFDSN